MTALNAGVTLNVGHTHAFVASDNWDSSEHPRNPVTGEFIDVNKSVSPIKELLGIKYKQVREHGNGKWVTQDGAPADPDHEDTLDMMQRLAVRLAHLRAEGFLQDKPGGISYHAVHTNYTTDMVRTVDGLWYTHMPGGWKTSGDNMDEYFDKERADGRIVDGSALPVSSSPKMLSTMSPEMTEAERDAVDYYGSDDGYMSINKTLRGVNDDIINDDYHDGEYTGDEMNDRKMIRVLDALIARTRSKKERTVYRVASGAWAKNTPVGTEFTDYGFTSTSVSRTVAKNFGKSGDELFEILIPAGSRGLYDNMRSEQEIILPRGSTFRVGVSSNGVTQLVLISGGPIS